MNRAMHAPLALLAALLMAIVTALPTSAGAQEFALVPLGPNTLSGIVVDSLGRPLADATVRLDQLKRLVTTGRDGRYRFDKVKPGTYKVEARRIGYVSESREVEVRERGGAARFQLVPTPFSLQTFITTAARGGLSGVIGDTAYRAVDGVEVRVVGSPYVTRTDSFGAFFLPVKPGRYFVTLKRAGYALQTVSVTVPPTEGRKIAAWMVPERERPNPREAAMLLEMPGRMIRASRVWSKFYTREDLEKLGATDMIQVATAGASRRLPPDCPVIIDGDPNRFVPLWDLPAADVEFVEIYVDPPERVTSGPNGAGSSRANLAANRVAMRATAPSSCGVTVYAWLRR